MARFCLTSLLISAVSLCTLASTENNKQYNILFLMSDDLRPQLGSYSGRNAPASVSPEMHTPSLDALAAESLVLQRAYVQQAVCNPSRSSALTGRRPDTTHVYSSREYFRTAGGNFTTIPQFFKEQGYNTIGLGKIFHLATRASADNDGISWSEPFFVAPNHQYWKSTGRSWTGVGRKKRRKKPLPDDQVAKKAIETLKKVGPAAKNGSKPFFLAVGFYKPHPPFNFPREMLDYYPTSEMRLPNNPYAPVAMPEAAWSAANGFFRYTDIAELNVTNEINDTNSLPHWKVKELRRAYYASVTYVDKLIGDILDELRAQDLEDDTIVSFWGDHGWQLGEHGLWSKQTNFELATRVPFMIRIPGKTDNGSVSYKPTEIVDLFPTLVEAAGYESLPLCPEIGSTETVLCTEGLSLLPLVEDPNEESWKSAAFSQFPRTKMKGRKKMMGYTVRTADYRYTEWPKFNYDTYTPDWSRLYGMELYDHRIDQEENVNRARAAEYRDVRREMRRLLRRGWRAQLTA